ncbi:MULTISPECIES: FkbM family methyltransferase [Synechococcales]|uniref:FkbM family methyltransferase n=1 Tax=unclassified Synechococcus TaxID=2626047 RepID=UPI000DB2714E|nr:MULTISPECIES: FkbM family methyltransferase [unclassified Synechococcus]MCT0212100.1 FkbM family methyltransferase [Synechococcus sp. CS-1326]MCT0234221.1 FkbM family methyltransferase [Synechococcus sp. CS-1327]PZU98200.1 MAG: FkbM family methyltransferase [Cyanobium sp.]
MVDLLPEGERIHILDVGAALSEIPSYQGLIDAGCARITGFEPDLAECDRLNQMYGDPHRFYPCFVGDGMPATFHQTNWALTGSLFEPNMPLLDKFQNLGELTRPVATYPVMTQRIDEITEIEGIDCIKIDVQGSELAVLQHAQRILPNVLLIQVEVEFVEMYRGQPMFSDVDAFIRGKGFQFHSFNQFGGRAFKPMAPRGDVNASFRQWLWSDAVYVADWMKLDELNNDQLRKYAVLAHDVLGSFDLAHLVLAALDSRIGGLAAELYLMMHGEVEAFRDHD